MNNKSRDIFLIVTTALCTLVIVFAAYNFMANFFPSSISFNPGEISSSEIKKFNDVRDVLKKDYYTNLDQTKLMEGALKGMVSSIGDKYTSYLTKEEWDARKERFAGEYKGIGISYNINPQGKVVIGEVLPNSPAQKAELMAGDVVKKIDGVLITIDSDIVKMFKEKGKDTVELEFYRPSQKKNFTKIITKEIIKEENATSKVIDGNIGYIDLIMFDQNIAKDFNIEIDKLTKQGIKGLIIDVRNNPGGNLDQVVKICDSLLPKATIVSVQNKNSAKEFYYSDAKSFELPVTLLMNEHSASASEVLAGALHDNKRGTLVGEKSYGKGLVQNTVELDDGSCIYFTTARYFTPNGICIHGIGIQPDVKVDLPSKYLNVPIRDIPQVQDTQLLAALEDVKAKIK